MTEHTNPTGGENRLRSEYDITADDGRVYRLKFGTNACCDIQRELCLGPDGPAKDIPALLQNMGTRRVEVLRTIVRFLLQRYHAEEVVSDEIAGDIIDALPSSELSVAVLCAYNGMTPEQLMAAAAAAKKRLRAKAGEAAPPKPVAEAGLPTS